MATAKFYCLMSHLSTKCEPSLENSFLRFSTKSVIPRFECASVTNSDEACLSLDAKKDNIIRQPGTSYFYPSLWDNYFLVSPPDSEHDHTSSKERIEELKKQVKNILSLAANDPYQELDLIDKIQRLCIAYHFETEIEDALQRIYDNIYFFDQNINSDRANLYNTALRFRVLRQAGYYVSTDVFNKFKDEKGEFRADLTKDVQGMLNLYEACYLSFNGEDIMDEALFFTTNHLGSIVTRLSAPLALQVKHALETPLQKGFKRLESRNQISIYEKDESHNESLLTLAKLDYNMVQLIHKEEIIEVKRWWQDLDLKSKVPFEIRDRVVEGYLLIMNIFCEPKYSLARIHLAKLTILMDVADSAYDVYADLKELQPLTNAFTRWSVEGVKDLREGLKIIFLKIANVLSEIEIEAIRRGGFNGSPYAIKEMKRYIEALMEEAKVIFSGDVPTLENWLPLSTTTAAINVFLTVAVLYMGELCAKEVYEWIDNMPKIIENAYIIIRLLDDIGTHKVEEHRGITLSSLTCYMKDHGVSQSEAIEKLHKMAASLWKDMNKECLRVNHVPMPLLTTVYNLTRSGVLFYENGADNYTNPKGRMEEVVASVLINPIPI